MSTRPESRFALRPTGEPVGDGGTGIRRDAELGDVLMEFFRDSYTETSGESFSEAATRCMLDDLAVLELAMASHNEVHEAPRLIERYRNRVMVARWLDARIAEAAAPPVEVSQ